VDAVRVLPIESAAGEYISWNSAALSGLTTDRISSGRKYTRIPMMRVGSSKVAAATAT
jgi:hypothetical protein